jgi:hypothetical protein
MEMATTKPTDVDIINLDFKDHETALYWLRTYLYNMMIDYKSYNMDMKSNAQLLKIVAEGMRWLALFSDVVTKEELEQKLQECSSGITKILEGHSKSLQQNDYVI